MGIDRILGNQRLKDYFKNIAAVDPARRELDK